MALNTSNNNLNKNNSSFWNKMVNKVQEVKNTINQVNAENEKANAVVKAVQDERILKTVGMDNKIAVKNDVKPTNIIRDDIKNIDVHVGSKKLSFESNFDIDLQSDKFIYANDEINTSKNNIDQVKKRLSDIMTYSKEIDDSDMFELSNDLNAIKNIEDNVNGISGDLSSIKANLNIIDPDFGNNSFLFDMAWKFGSDLVKSKENSENNNGVNPLFGEIFKNGVNPYENGMDLVCKNAESNGYDFSDNLNNEVPRIFQTDYSNVRYGGYNEVTGQPKTVATSGCGITCMAMVDSYYNGEFVTPADVISTSGYYGCSTGTGYEFFSMYSEKKNLPYVETIDYSTTESFDKVKEYLAEGGLVIANMTANSVFTKDAHYILLTGINEEGKIMVNDPNKDNYKEFNDNPGKSFMVGKILTDGFENGFDESQFWYGRARKFWVFLENDSSLKN